jgi:hypothetical protein
LAAAHGTTGILKIYSGSLRDVSNYFEVAELDRKYDEAETSGLGDLDKEFILGLHEAEIKSNGNYDATLDGYLAVIEAARVSFACEYYPSDDASGCVKYAFNGLLTNWKTGSPVDGKANVDVTIKVTGAVTRTVV